MTKHPIEKNLRDEMFDLAHGMTGFNQWFLGPMYLGRTSCQCEHLAVITFGSWWAGSNGTSGREGPGTRAGS